MVLWQALILGLIQGVGELFPVSSLAQTILIPAVLRWPIDVAGVGFLAFVVALHLATAVALVAYFWKDWLRVVQAYAGSVRRKQLVYDANSKFAWLLVAGTVVVGGVGFVFEKRFRRFFEDPHYYWVVAAILVFNGIGMIVADKVKQRATRIKGMGQPERKRADELTFAQGTAVGAAQTLALFPGVSRSGVTIIAGLLSGLSYEEACRFSFMLATPVIGLAALLKVPSLLRNHDALVLAAPAAVVAGVTAYVSLAFLMRYFKSHGLSAFGYYCILSGGIAWALLAFGV